MKLEKNASVCMKALPFWIIPYTFYMYYLSLFLMEKGLSSSQITFLMTITNAASLVFSFVASPIVDRMGRKNALLVFDILSASVPAIIFYFSQSFFFAALAMVLSGLNRIMSTAYYLILIEDTSDENSIKSMNVFNIISVVSGLMTPLAGIIITKMGIVNGEKLFLLVSFVLMTVQAVVRHIFISETPTGLEVKKNRTKGNESLFSTYKRTFAYIFKEKSVLSALIINAMVYVYYNIGTTTSLLFTPYFANYRSISGVLLSCVGGVYSGGTLFSMLVINPRLTKQNIYKYTVVASLVSIIGFVLIIICPMGNNIVLFTAIVLLALSYGVIKSVGDALLAMESEGEFATGIYSLSFVLAAVFSIVALQAVQVLYEVSPNWMFGLSMILVLIILSDCLIYQRRKNNA